MWDAGAGDVEHAFEVGVDEFVPVGVCDVGGGVVCGVYAGAVEDVVDSAVFVHY